jgi:hypothetical protein
MLPQRRLGSAAAGPVVKSITGPEAVALGHHPEMWIVPPKTGFGMAEYGP